MISLSENFYRYVNAHELLLIPSEINNYDLDQSGRGDDDLCYYFRYRENGHVRNFDQGHEQNHAYP